MWSPFRRSHRFVALAFVWQSVNPTAALQQQFQDRVAEYVKVRQQLDSTLPKLNKTATPAELDTHQRALSKLVAENRKAAKRGDIFGAEFEALVRGQLAAVFQGDKGRQLVAAILDDHPPALVLKVNARYPDDVPLSTMPQEVLQALPKLPETLEYRFVGYRLVLFDVPAHLIVDFIDNVLPKR